MRKKAFRQSHMDILAAFLLLAAFAAAILAVLLSGARSYRRLTERDMVAYHTQTEALYLTTKLRQTPVMSEVTVTNRDGIDFIEITTWEDFEPYTTMIYCYNGSLLELFAYEGYDFTMGDGEKVADMRRMNVSDDGERIYIDFTTADGEDVSLIFARGGAHEK